MNIIKPVHAASKPLGTFKGVGPFQQVKDDASVGTGLGNLISQIVTVFTVLAGIFFVIYFMIGAFKWITSGGDQNKTEEAKRQLTQAAIGIIVVAVSYFIVSIVGGVLGLNILNPAATLGI
jgi:cytochrome bd-type quinol oxidase subunit 2